MAKIKNTKNELKNQRDALKRFQRFLPTLLLKKQQLQLELRQVDERLTKQHDQERALQAAIKPWVKLFADDIDLTPYVHIKDIKISSGNVAGVNIPVLDDVVFEKSEPDLHATPLWVDDGIRAIEELIASRIQISILEQQKKLLLDELRVTTQRVNLFEKVKIPEAKEHIRVIRIFLGDQQTADVARSKLVKSKLVERETAA